MTLSPVPNKAQIKSKKSIMNLHGDLSQMDYGRAEKVRMQMEKCVWDLTDQSTDKTMLMHAEIGMFSWHNASALQRGRAACFTWRARDRSAMWSLKKVAPWLATMFFCT